MATRRRWPGSARRSACRKASRSRSHDDLAEHFAVLEEAKGLVDVLQGQLAIDDRLELALLDQAQQGEEILAYPAVRAQHSQLEGPDEAKVFLGIEAGGGPAGEHLALTVQHPQRGHPRVAAREVDDHVHAPRELSPVRLAELLVNPLHEVVLGVVEQMRSAQI